MKNKLLFIMLIFAACFAHAQSPQGVPRDECDLQLIESGFNVTRVGAMAIRTDLLKTIDDFRLDLSAVTKKASGGQRSFEYLATKYFSSPNVPVEITSQPKHLTANEYVQKLAAFETVELQFQKIHICKVNDIGGNVVEVDVVLHQIFAGFKKNWRTFRDSTDKILRFSCLNASSKGPMVSRIQSILIQRAPCAAHECKEVLAQKPDPVPLTDTLPKPAKSKSFDDALKACSPAQHFSADDIASIKSRLDNMYSQNQEGLYSVLSTKKNYVCFIKDHYPTFLDKANATFIKYEK